MGDPGQLGSARYGSGERASHGRGVARGNIGRIHAAGAHPARSYWCRNRRVRVDVAVSGEGRSAPPTLDGTAGKSGNEAVVLLQLHRELLNRTPRSGARAA